MELIIVGVIVLLIIIFAVVLYNSLVRLRNEVDNGWSNIDVQLKRRNDLIPNIVNAVKGYAAHERETLEAVTAARSASVQADDVASQAQADNMLSGALGKLFALAEAYPDLKANQNFLQLQNELTVTEDKIQAARRYYNNTVNKYNTKTQTLPSNIIAKMGGFSPREFYEISDPAEREVPVVDFGG